MKSFVGKDASENKDKNCFSLLYSDIYSPNSGQSSVCLLNWNTANKIGLWDEGA